MLVSIKMDNFFNGKSHLQLVQFEVKCDISENKLNTKKDVPENDLIL